MILTMLVILIIALGALIVDVVLSKAMGIE